MNEARPLKAHIFDRADDEFYVEPQWVSDALFDAEIFDGSIWDPACGMGNIVESAKFLEFDVVGTDIMKRFAFQPDCE